MTDDKGVIVEDQNLPEIRRLCDKYGSGYVAGILAAIGPIPNWFEELKSMLGEKGER